MLADPCLEPLSGASNVRGIAASTSEFIDNTRHQLSGQAVFKAKERTDGERIGEGRNEVDLRIEGVKGRDKRLNLFGGMVIVEGNRKIKGQFWNSCDFWFV